MMKYFYLAALSLILLGNLSAQSFNMIRNNSDSTTLCNGTLYDHGGPTGSYFNNSNDYFYINPPGNGTLTITFNSFNTENCCDRVWIYDGTDLTNLYGNYRGTSIPNSGNPITLSSGAAVIRFTSDGSVTRSGFSLTWSGGTNLAPTASFTTSNTNPALGQPVTFTSTSANSGLSIWDFGDGTTSTGDTVTHAYQSPGTFSVKLIANNCNLSDSLTSAITVQNAALLTISPDTINGTVACGQNYSDTIYLQNTGGGAAYASVSATNLGDQTHLLATFETGTSPFSPGSTSTFHNGSAVLGNAAVGNGSLGLSGSGNFSSNNMEANISPVTANYISYHVKASATNSRSYISIGQEVGSVTYEAISSEVYFGNLRFFTSSGTKFYAITAGTWYHIEYRNIDFNTQTFDIYVDGQLEFANQAFINFNASNFNSIRLYNLSNYPGSNYDHIEVKTVGDISNFTLANTSINTSSTAAIPFTVNLSNSTAGLKQYLLTFRTNAIGSDSLITVPVNLNVTGAPAFSSNRACVNFDTLFINQSASDSIWIQNPGCDSLNFASISPSNSRYTVSPSSLNIAPGDSAMLMLNFTASTFGLFNDTLNFTGNLDTSLCITSGASLAPSIAVDSATYTVNSYGCNDSVPINVQIFNSGSGTLPLNWTIGTSTSLFDDFETGAVPNSAIWSTIGSNQIFNGCYERSGTNALSMMGTNRTAETVPLNLNAGDSVALWAFPGNGGGSGCENPDGSEDLFVQYRLASSGFWTTLGTIYNYNTAAQRYSFAIPQSGSMQVRLYQSNYTGSTFDHYRVDDFEIISNSAGSFSPSSGFISAGDSITTTGYLDVRGLVSGNYSRSILINSNDPIHPDTVINVSLNIFGEPLLMQSAVCLSYDTIFSGASQTDSVLVWNAGCDSVHATGLNFNGTQFSSSISSFSLGLEDSLWLPISFNPNTINLGQQLDTLSIISNDTIRTICLSGFSVGAPSASFNPDSISINITNCGDSIGVPVYLRNSGLSALNYNLEQGNSNTSTNGKTKVLLLATSSYTTERNNLNSIFSARSDIDYQLIYVYTALDLKNYLDTSDVIVLPEMSSTFYAGIFSPELQNFANNGGTIIMTYNGTSRMNSYNIMPISSTFSAPSTITIDEPNHPLMAGLPATGLSNLSATLVARFTNTTNLLQVAGKSGNDEAVVATQPYGDGQAIFIGYDYYQTNTDIIQLMNNAIDWSTALQGPPNFISASPDSGAVAPSDSVLINIGINTAGIPNGTYDYILNWATNDPLNPTLALPIHLVINGTANLAVVDNSCINFSGIRQGATAIDTFRVANDGCDTLDITSFSSTNAAFSLSNLVLNVAPGDTADLLVNFSPLAVGSFNDTITVSTNDTTFSICLNASSVGAPVLELERDTLAFTLNKCKVIGTESFKIRNPGQGTLNFDMQIGRFRDSSQISYNTIGASTIHNFSGLPNSADSIKLRIIINGDFDAFSERATLYLDGSYQQIVYDNNRYYQQDTIDLFVVGTQVATLLSDGILDVGLYNSSSVDGLAGSFHRVEIEVVQNINWVSVLGANSGTIQPLDSANRNFIFNAATLPVGQHLSTLIINNNAPGANPTTVPIVFNVISEPEIALSDTCAFYTLTPLGDTTTRSVTIYNNGCQPLVISSMTSTSNQFKINQSATSIPVGDSLELDIDFIPTSVGNFNASIFIISNDTNRSICLVGQSGAQPVADFTSSDENICIGEVSFTHSAVYFNTLLWDFGDGFTSNQTNPTHAYALPGTYTVTLRASNTIGFDTISKQVTVNPLIAKFSVNKDTLQLSDTARFADSTQGAVTWIWDFGDGNSSTQQNPTHVYTAQGIFTVRLTVIDARSCSRSTTKQVRVENKISLQERPWLENYQLYPNPSRESFKLQSPNMDWSDYRFTLVDAQGRLVLDQNGTKNAQQEFTTSQLAMGMYRLMIYQNSELIAIEKVVVQD